MAIREWARANGHPVNERGRVGHGLVEAFFAANPDAYERAEKTEAVQATARTPGASPEDYAWQDEGPLGPIYTITLVRGVEEHEVLRRLGAASEHIRLVDVDESPTPAGVRSPWCAGRETGHRHRGVRLARHTTRGHRRAVPRWR
ncbi:Lsr2 family DNA-binding protein [Microbispora rosea]|uniref:Lsr2 family DNA-binding protein n=1 Tax=Microbispora rosea TaxID=58117 RepID=UPI00342ABB4E